MSGKRAKQVRAYLKTIRNPDFRAFVEQAIHKAEKGDPRDLEYAFNLKRWPVSFEEFVKNSDEYLGNFESFWPGVFAALVELCSGDYNEAVLTGSIGSGKTHIAVFATAYQLYLISCLKNPHKVYGLDPSSEILFVFQSITATLAKELDYGRFRTLIENSPYFQAHFPFDKTVLSELRFPNRVIVRPISGSDTAAIGQNVFGGVIDEVNFMAVVENSKQSIDGGVYDQAVALYNSIARRRKSRFMKAGKLPGLLCIVSSKRYPGQFTDKREEVAKKEIAEKGTTDIYVYDKRTWDVRNPEEFTGEWFQVFAGDDTRQPRILTPDEEVHAKDKALVHDIPVEYRTEFEDDIAGSLRDIAGVSTLAKHPFILNRESMSDCFAKGARSVLSRERTDFSRYDLRIYPKRIVRPEEPRWVHFDLSQTGDATGVAIGHISRFVKIKRGDHIETLPEIYFDAVLQVAPPPGGEIEYHKIRQVLYKLKELGMNLKWATADTHQSVDTLQTLRRKGWITDYISTDTSVLPYELTKRAFYDGRVVAPAHEAAQREFASLELDVKKNKVDHPPTGSKDCSDAMAGCLYGLVTRRELWVRHGASLNELPDSMKVALAKSDSAEMQQYRGGGQEVRVA